MYNRIGRKIKGLAVFFCIIGIFFQVILGLLIIFMGGSILPKLVPTLPAEFASVGCIIVGIFVIVIGSIVTWMSTWFLYGYGELIDKVSNIEEDVYYIRKR